MKGKGTLKQGFIAHYTEHIQMKFKKDNSTPTLNNRENIILLSKHFYSVYNRETSIDWNFINTISYYKTLYNISDVMQRNEIYDAINHLK